eukprot:TRINITY_DN5834_c0_g1_i4.p1 TRINITY_DN5834_c0_g1~~TRINITY_DN5834_c0_g1_i4.p1  ORF type:complete len:153 (+),score=68.57 TRINITY_DN5834_c0_g1_i4:89-547(+)
MESPIVKEDVDDLKRLFQLYDHSKTGVIRPEQLYDLLRKSRFPVAKSDFKDFLAAIDPSGRNAIAFDQLLAGVRAQASSTSLKQELTNAFRVFDSGDTGYVRAGDLVEAMKGLQASEGMGEEEIRELVEEVDFDGDGKIEYEKFVEMMLELE